MKFNDLASKWLSAYAGTDVRVTAISETTCYIAFDLSDGTHWFADDNDTAKLIESVVGLSIGWSDSLGWVLECDDPPLVTPLPWA